ncbi:hypothetical protein, partial [Anaplasma phagocytophilum]|uniref:hypothetical protein n=1 Tax=Anaplasma phagocytophilum TaxID=948 RepID=UPI003977A727
LVPTPSVEDTSKGERYLCPAANRSNTAPNPPISDITLSLLVSENGINEAASGPQTCRIYSSGRDRNKTMVR